MRIVTDCFISYTVGLYTSISKHFCIPLDRNLSQGCYNWSQVHNCTKSGANYTKLRHAPHCRVLPRDKFNNMSLYFYLLYLLLLTYLLLNRPMKMTRNITRFTRCICFIGGSEKSRFYFSRCSSDVLSPSRMHVTAFSINQQLHQWHFVIRFPVFNEALFQVADVASFPSLLC